MTTKTESVTPAARATKSKGELLVRISAPYGVETVYPENELSKLFTELLGQKSLTRKNIEVIKRLGYTVKAVQNKEVIL